ncbi:hypothetical protein CC1G_05901 [Coprinopsis cinerea okayama7|uniref:GATA-type domain-containing protein n=1 Tax=Coprinopsis cinerea (strain Okayama-7 / 130 / ATCC MYA-4618 / FGSC 9003) TaxID=240176 RepID=A8NAF0_COPC7|nr:hypothetical protein CC1G_05901 [Coprinopsis cinerea okayama7\|eukprot:XP_001831802.2 hypothetical protein CC1G_05901 [Coprinopsis cinerea okayama7\
MSPVVVEAAPINLHNANLAAMARMQLHTPTIPSEEPQAEQQRPAEEPTPATNVIGPTRAPCLNCGTTETPLWRRDADGNPLCNACAMVVKDLIQNQLDVRFYSKLQCGRITMRYIVRKFFVVLTNDYRDTARWLSSLL